jgi:hypothetical protein
MLSIAIPAYNVAKLDVNISNWLEIDPELGELARKAKVSSPKGDFMRGKLTDRLL